MKKNIRLMVFSILFCGTNICNAQITKTDSLLNSLKYAKDDTNKVNILYQLSEVSSEDSSVMNYAQQALFLAEKLNYQKGIAAACNNIGYVYNQKGEISLAFKYYMRSLKIRETTGDKNEMAPLLNNIAAVFERQGAISSALEYYHKSLTIREELHDSIGIAKVLNNIVLLYKGQEDTTHAFEYLERSLKIMIALNDSNGIAMTLLNIGFVYQGQNNHTKAEEYFERSYEIYSKTGNKKGIASALSDMSVNYAIKGNFEEALDYSKQSLKISEENGDQVIVAATLSNIGILYFKKNEYNLAEEFCLKSLKIAEKIRVPERISYASESLSKIYSKEGKYKEAYQMHVLFKQMADSISNRETQKATVKKQMQYDFDKQQTVQKVEQEKKDALAKQELGKQKLLRNSIAGGSGIIILSSLFIFFFYKRKRDAEQKQKETSLSLQVSETEMKALRSQMNPHFIFNALQSIQTFLLGNKSEDANNYLLKFTKLMRLVLENSQHSEVSLKEDMQALELYMQLESIRLAHPFTYDLHIDDSVDIENDNIPPLILQPFVENSIWHGLQYKTEPGHINIYISKKDNALYATVEDNGVGRDMSKKFAQPLLLKKESLGMKLTEERLKILNELKKIKAQFKITDLFTKENKPAGTKVELSLPLVA